MLYIREWSIAELKDKFSEDKYTVEPYCPPGTWQTSRYIQIFIEGCDKDIHYEYLIEDWKGRVELHFEGEWEQKYSSLIERLFESTADCEELIWEEWSCGYRCRHLKEIETVEELYQTFLRMTNLLAFSADTKEFVPEERIIEFDPSISYPNSGVELYEMNYAKVIRHRLAIPNYQRIYCWEEHHVRCLLDDVFEHISSEGEAPYRLGTIILHARSKEDAQDKVYDIIDGQQRLVTLALLLSELGVKTSLLKEKFSSKQSIEYIAYNKHLIHRYIKRYQLNVGGRVEKLLKQIEFSVLLLQDTPIDLAYTFFSNQNSRGVALSDYDLLKAHHLRYIPSGNEGQARHAAEVWNQMIEEGRREIEQNTQPDYERTLDTYIYRLRKWMRKAECDDSTGNYRIKREYEAAPIIEEIPPFGEQFYFNEPIQGGPHFFSYVERHRHQYQAFCQTKEYKELHTTMQGGSGEWYRDAIESVLFCFFLKFGIYYLAEALVVIMRIILQHRYTSSRAMKISIVRYIGDSDLVVAIDRATSPTFFLAEAMNKTKELFYPEHRNMTPIMRFMKRKARKINQGLRERIVVKSFKDLNR